MKKRPFAQTAFLSILGRAGGAAIPFLIAAVYGASARTDAFFFAYSLAIAVTTLFSHMFEAAIIPYLASEHADFSKAAWLLRRAFFISLPIFMLLGGGVSVALKPFLASISGWSAETAAMTGSLFTEFQPFLWFGLAASAWNGIFYHRKIFWLPAISPLVRALIVIVFLFAGHGFLGIHALTLGFVFGELARVLLAWLLAGHFLPKAMVRVTADSVQGTLNHFFKDAVLQTAALLAVNLMVISDQWFAGRAGEGYVTLLCYADRLLQIPYLLFVAGFLNIFHADWADANASVSRDFWSRLKKDMILVACGAAAVAIIMGFTAKFWIAAFYGTQKISTGERSVLTSVFIWYAAGFAPGIVRLALGRALIVLKESRFYLGQAWAELGLNILLNWTFMRFFGVPGIAMATACAYCLSAAWLTFFLLRKRKVSVQCVIASTDAHESAPQSDVKGNGRHCE